MRLIYEAHFRILIMSLINEAHLLGSFSFRLYLIYEAHISSDCMSLILKSLTPLHYVRYSLKIASELLGS